MKQTIFTGSGTAIVTPMNEDFSINYEKLGQLIDWQLAQGTDAIVICGTTGESTTMSDEEHVACIRCAVERVAGRVPVVAGTGSNDTAYAIWLAKEAKAAGADALLQVTPYYNKTSQLGLIRHFNAIADVTDLPIILYNVPSRTGLDIKPETYLELSKHPNIVATKEANGNIASSVRTASLCGDNLQIYSGEDALAIPLMSLGGKGVISVISNVAPKATHDMCQAFLDGDTAKAAQLQLRLSGLVDAMFCDVNPIPVKYALNLMGKAVGPCRMPLVEPGPAQAKQIEMELKNQGLL